MLEAFYHGPDGTRELTEDDHEVAATEWLSPEREALARERRAALPTQSREEFVAERRASNADAIRAADPVSVTSDGFVRVSITVRGEIAVPSRMSALTHDERRSAVLDAEEAANDFQSAVRSHLEAVGARSVTSLWLGNTLQAEVPLAAVDGLWTRDDVLDVAVNRPARASAMDGLSLRDGTLASALISSGLNGDPPGSQRVRLGFIEENGAGGNWPAVAHPAFNDASPSFTGRFLSMWDCNACTAEFLGICYQWGCQPKTVVVVTESHGTFVSSIAGASVEQAQDPAVTNATQRIRRSGMASETDLLYYSITDCDAVGRAIQRAVSDGVHVLNGSLNIPDVRCDRSYDCGGVNNAIRSAFNAGTTIVFSAGDRVSSSCGIEYPAYRPEVIAVGAMDSSASAPVYDALALASYSPVGGMTIRYNTGASHTMAAMGLVAPGDYELRPTSVGPPAGYSTYSPLTASGTSFAAPVVSGGAALYTDAAIRFGWGTSAFRTMNNLLLMGDRWNGGIGSLSVGVSNQTGMGRFRVRAPGFAPFAGTGPFGWGGAVLAITEGTQNIRNVGSSGPETGVAEWRWVTSTYAHDLNNVDYDYVIEAVDTCRDPGLVIAADFSFDLRKRIRLSSFQLCPAGGTCRCIQMRTTVLSGPAPGASVIISSTDFFANTAI